MVATILLVFSLDADANTLSHFKTLLKTDVAVAGVGAMRDTGGSGVITINRLPGTVTVTKAYLYWQGPTNSLDPTANASGLVNGIAVTGTNIGFSGENCWDFGYPYKNSQAYRANITQIVKDTPDNDVGTRTFFLEGFSR